MARRGSQKRRSDPNAPKRGRTAWQMFFAENRAEVAKQNPNLNGQEVLKKLGEMWRQSDDGTKRRYQKQQESGQAEYEEKLSAYKEEQKDKKSRSQSSKSQSSKSQSNNNNNNSNNNNGQSKKGNNKNNEETNDSNSNNQS